MGVVGNNDHLDNVDDDLKLYIRHTVLHLAKAKMIEGSPLHHRIEEAFHRGAEGTFLWVGLASEELNGVSS